jgi:hypothetical protein
MKSTLKWLLPASMSLLSPTATPASAKRVDAAEERDLTTQAGVEQDGVWSMRRRYVRMRVKFIFAMLSVWDGSQYRHGSRSRRSES